MVFLVDFENVFVEFSSEASFDFEGLSAVSSTDYFEEVVCGGFNVRVFAVEVIKPLNQELI